MFFFLINFLLSLLSTAEMQFLIIGVLERLARSTESPVDDKLVELFKQSVLSVKNATISHGNAEKVDENSTQER